MGDLIQLNQLNKARNIDISDLPTPPKKKDNTGGGEPPMSNDKYVTHEELNHVVDKLDAKIDLSTERLLRHIDEKTSQNKIELTDKITNSNNQLVDKLNENKIELTDKITNSNNQLVDKLNENKNDIVGLRHDLSAYDKKLTWIVSIITPIITALLLKFFHLS